MAVAATTVVLRVPTCRVQSAGSVRALYSPSIRQCAILGHPILIAILIRTATLTPGGFVRVRVCPSGGGSIFAPPANRNPRPCVPQRQTPTPACHRRPPPAQATPTTGWTLSSPAPSAMARPSASVLVAVMPVTMQRRRTAKALMSYLSPSSAPCNECEQQRDGTEPNHHAQPRWPYHPPNEAPQSPWTSERPTPKHGHLPLSQLLCLHPIVLRTPQLGKAQHASRAMTMPGGSHIPHPRSPRCSWR